MNCEFYNSIYEGAALFVKDLFEKEEKEKLIEESIEDFIKPIIIDLTSGNLEYKKSWRNLLKHYFIYSHKVSVCVTTIKIASKLGFSTPQLMELGISALLYDIGLSRIPRSILDQKARLSEQDYLEVRKHVAYGREILERVKNIPEVTQRVAYEHHERCDGSGYPQGLNKEAVHNYTKIIAVVDVYEAVIRPRPWRDRLDISDILRLLEESQGRFFDAHIVKTLMNIISLFPLGSIVELNTDEVAEVVEINEGYPFRPVVNVIYDVVYKREPCLPRTINLVEEPAVSIKEIIADYNRRYI